jgi:hypothetical protein
MVLEIFYRQESCNCASSLQVFRADGFSSCQSAPLVSMIRVEHCPAQQIDPVARYRLGVGFQVRVGNHCQYPRLLLGFELGKVGI